MFNKLACLLAILLLPCALLRAEDLVLHSFDKIVVSEQFYAEGANYGDFNQDGVMDVVSGPYWYEGPDFKKKHEYYPAKAFDKGAYSKNFFTFVYDFNGDKFPDILVYGFPGEDASWYENPKGGEGPWVRHKIFDSVDNESPTFADITGDGKPEIVCSTAGQLGYAEADWSDPAKPWTFHAISPKGGYNRFTHGLGVGDINGDGKMDILEKDGWWEQPADLSKHELWTFHKFSFGSGGSQMMVYDVDGDGLNDVVCSLEAHGWGLAWFQQVKENGQITFKKHLIMGSKPEDNKYGIKFSQMHAVDLVDIDGDGIKDIVTGKRHWAHGQHGDPEPTGPAVLYWFKTVRGKDGVEFIPYKIDDDSGVGTQVVTGDLNGDKLPDIVVGNKRGTFVFLHKTKTVSKEEWDKAQPVPAK